MAEKDRIIDLNKRLYRWSLITYANPSEFFPLLNKCKHFAYAYHDKDIGKEPHYHLIITFETFISLSKIRKLIISTQNTFGEPLKDNLLAYEYLYHKNDIDKYQYDESIIVCDSKEFWTSCKDSKTFDNETFITDLLNLSNYQMALKYGRDFIKNYSRYSDFRDLLKSESNFANADTDTDNLPF